MEFGTLESDRRNGYRLPNLAQLENQKRPVRFRRAGQLELELESGPGASDWLHPARSKKEIRALAGLSLRGPAGQGLSWLAR